MKMWFHGSKRMEKLVTVAVLGTILMAVSAARIEAVSRHSRWQKEYIEIQNMENEMNRSQVNGLE